MATSTLKGLSFTTLPAAAFDPVVDRRNRLVTRLTEQKSLIADPTFKRTVRVKKDGAMVDQPQKVLPWFRGQGNGSFLFFIRVGFRPLDFGKGNTAISVQTLDQLPAVIDTLIQAVRQGELDQQLAAAAAASARKLKKAPKKAS